MKGAPTHLDELVQEARRTASGESGRLRQRHSDRGPARRRPHGYSVEATSGLCIPPFKPTHEGGGAAAREVGALCGGFCGNAACRRARRLLRRCASLLRAEFSAAPVGVRDFTDALAEARARELFFEEGDGVARWDGGGPTPSRTRRSRCPLWAIVLSPPKGGELHDQGCLRDCRA